MTFWTHQGETPDKKNTKTKNGAVGTTINREGVQKMERNSHKTRAHGLKWKDRGKNAQYNHDDLTTIVVKPVGLACEVEKQKVTAIHADPDSVISGAYISGISSLNLWRNFL